MFAGLFDDAEALAAVEPAAGGALEPLALLLLLLLQAASASPAAAIPATTAQCLGNRCLGNRCLGNRWLRSRRDAGRNGTARLLCACSLGGGLAVRPVSRVPARLTGFLIGARSAHEAVFFQ